MKTKSFLFLAATATLCSFAAADSTSEAQDALSAKRLELFQAFDADASQSVDQGELLSLMGDQADKRQKRLAKIATEGKQNAAKRLENRNENARNDLIGTPESASAFLVANFDRNGDEALDLQEFSKAFDTLRKWRINNREERQSLKLAAK